MGIFGKTSLSQLLYDIPNIHPLCLLGANNWIRFYIEGESSPGNLYNKGQKYLKDQKYEKAFIKFKEAAIGNHPESQFQLPYMYDLCLGTVQDQQITTVVLEVCNRPRRYSRSIQYCTYLYLWKGECVSKFSTSISLVYEGC